MPDAIGNNGRSLLLLGASVRAAAHSARRAQLQPVGIDLFADRDLAACAHAHRVAPGDYPHGLEAAAAALPHSPWMYTGALENHPELIDAIAQHRPLWGNTGGVVRAVRDPFLVADGLERAGMPHPAVRATSTGLPRDGTWLIKPIASAGGSGIVPLQARHQSIGKPCYFQERIEGVPLGAVFVGASGGARLVGATWQWVGRPGAPFGYCGSVGPWPLSDLERARVAALGNVLASHFGLRGLFGVDLILKQGCCWPVEVNPRYTASVEVLELGLGRSLLSEHRAAFDPDVHARERSAQPRGGWGLGLARPPLPSQSRCEPGMPDLSADEAVSGCHWWLRPLVLRLVNRAGRLLRSPASFRGFDRGHPTRSSSHRQSEQWWQPPVAPGGAPGQPSIETTPQNVVGKVILFAQAPLMFSVELRHRPFEHPFELPGLADLPWPGTAFRAGEPVMTLFASAPDVATCRARLERALGRWSARLHACMIS